MTPNPYAPLRTGPPSGLPSHEPTDDPDGLSIEEKRAAVVEIVERAELGEPYLDAVLEGYEGDVEGVYDRIIASGILLAEFWLEDGAFVVEEWESEESARAELGLDVVGEASSGPLGDAPDETTEQAQESETGGEAQAEAAEPQTSPDEQDGGVVIDGPVTFVDPETGETILAETVVHPGADEASTGAGGDEAVVSTGEAEESPAPPEEDASDGPSGDPENGYEEAAGEDGPSGSTEADEAQERADAIEAKAAAYVIGGKVPATRDEVFDWIDKAKDSVTLHARATAAGRVEAERPEKDRRSTIVDRVAEILAG